jgi:hypothetical protein
MVASFKNSLTIRPSGAGINILLERSRVDIFDKAGMDTVGKADKARMDTGKGWIAADITCNASHATRSTGHTVAHTTEFHPNIGRNNRDIPVLVHHGSLEQTKLKA